VKGGTIETLSGVPRYNTLRLKGLVQGKCMNTLVDGGATHNFRDEIEKAIKEWLVMGHIRPKMSPFASSIILVLKKDGTLRMCIDYRALKKKTIKNRYPIPRIDELMTSYMGQFSSSRLIYSWDIIISASGRRI
jgi:hypothetical protein